MRRIIATFVTLTLVVAGYAAHADDASRLKLAHDLVGATHASDKVAVLIPALIAQSRQAMAQKGDMDLAGIDAALQRFKDHSQGEVDRHVDILASIYAKEFTEDDLANILIFYRTPTGQTLAAKEVEMGGAIASAMRNWAKDLADRIASEVAKGTAAKPALDPQRWRSEYIAAPARAAVVQRYVDPMDKPQWTALRTVTLAKVISERCRGSPMDLDVLKSYLDQTGLGDVTIGDLDLMKSIVAPEFDFFDTDRLQTLCAAADYLFGDGGKLVPKLVLPGNGVPSTYQHGYMAVLPFTDFPHQRG